MQLETYIEKVKQAKNSDEIANILDAACEDDDLTVKEYVILYKAVINEGF